MPLPENQNLDENQDDNAGNEFEQNEGQDTGNEILDTEDADTAGIDAATRASESAFTLNVEDGIAPAPDKVNDKGDNDQHNIKQ